MSGSGAGLALDGVSVQIDGTTLLEAVSLHATPGAVTAVIGPSGAGKTTLLRAIAGLVPLSAGTVRIHGEDLAGVPVHERGLGLVAQDAALFPHLDVAGNVGFGLRVRGWSRAARAERCADLLHLVGLAGYGPRRVHTLSGGERQRVALARALAPEPRVLLLDEPFGALDRSLRERLAHEVAELVPRLGVCAVHVTHDQQEAASVATHLVVLRAGRAIQAGAPHDLHAAPADAWVARFLGHRNVVDVALLPDALAATLDAAVGAVLVPEEAVQLAGPTPGHAAEGASRVGLSGIVRAVRWPPARAGVLVEVEGCALWASLRGDPPAPGAAIELTIDATTMRVLPTP